MELDILQAAGLDLTPAWQAFILGGNQAFAWSEATSLADFALPWSRYFLAEDLTGQPLAYVALHQVMETVDINGVYVDPGLRRQGLGRQLLEAVIAYYLAQGQVQRLVLEVRQSNQGAVALYAGLGFQVIHRRPGYYRDPVEAALVMAYELRSKGRMEKWDGY